MHILLYFCCSSLNRLGKPMILVNLIRWTKFRLWGVSLYLNCSKSPCALERKGLQTFPCSSPKNNWNTWILYIKKTQADSERKEDELTMYLRTQGTGTAGGEFLGFSLYLIYHRLVGRFGTSSFFHVQFFMLLLDLHADFSCNMIWYCHLVKNFPVCCDWHNQRV